MTSVVHHGPPGSYKSFGVLQDEAIPALQAGRTVVTNVRGFDSIETIEQALNIDIPDSAELITIPHNKEGFEAMARFYHWAPKGALIFMDEGQRIYSTRLKSLTEFDYPGGKVQAEKDGRPATLEDAFDQHRHHNWDIYITTTNIAKIHKEIRQVCEYGYRHRNLTGLLPWYKDTWKEVQHDPSNNGQSASHSIGQPKKKKADKRYFNCYSSTQTGEATNAIHTPSIFKQPKIAFFALIILCAVMYQFWFWLLKGDSETVEETTTKIVAPVVANPAPPVNVVADGSVRVTNTPASTRQSTSVNYLDHPVMHQRGQFIGTIDNRYKRNHIFRFYDDEGRFYQVTSNELKQLGFNVSAMGCVAQIEYEGQYRFIHCYDQQRPEKENHDNEQKTQLAAYKPEQKITYNF